MLDTTPGITAPLAVCITAPLNNVDGKANVKVKGLRLGGDYRTKPGDTLNAIIQAHLRDLPVRISILRQAIVMINPHAFKRKNPNWMYAGKRIKLPTVKDIKRVVFKREPEKAARSASTDQWIQYP